MTRYCRWGMGGARRWAPGNERAGTRWSELRFKKLVEGLGSDSQGIALSDREEEAQLIQPCMYSP